MLMQRSRALGGETSRLMVVSMEDGEASTHPEHGDELPAPDDPEQGTPAWLRAAGRPAFEELRNVLLMLGLRVSGARSYMAGLAPAMRACEPMPHQAEKVRAIGDALDDLDEAVREIEAGVGVLRDTLLAVEELVVAPRRSTRLVEVVGIADQLAHHHTRPAGGVRWQSIGGDARIDVSRSSAIGVLSTALSLLGLRVAQGAQRRPIDALCDRGHFACEVRLGSTALYERDVEACAVQLERMFGDEANLAISVRRANLVIELARAA